MKKLIAVVLILSLTVSLNACCGCPIIDVITQLYTEEKPVTIAPEPIRPDQAIETLPLYPEESLEFEFPEIPTLPEDSTVLPLPQNVMDFYFSSGAGAWGTNLMLSIDGLFSGDFHDTDMGSTGEGYPYGTVYTCSFSGEFTNVEQINDFSYRMQLSDLTLEIPEGEEWIEDQVLYVASGPYGIDGGSEFILYLPHTPISQFPEDSLYWWPLRYEFGGDPTAPLSCFGILNVETGDAFFSY